MSMATVASHAPTATNSSASSSVANGHAAADHLNSNGVLPDSQTSQPPTSATAPMGKKGKPKKAADPSETGKLLAAKINQLELDAAGEKDQELEIGR